jgi:hypothetical protein
MARKDRCKMYQGKEYLGYCAAKKEFFCGIKVHIFMKLLVIKIRMV